MRRSKRTKCKCSSPLMSAKAKVLPLASDTASVSYTHLDVYKRQIPSDERHQAIIYAVNVFYPSSTTYLFIERTNLPVATDSLIAFFISTLPRLYATKNSLVDRGRMRQP